MSLRGSAPLVLFCCAAIVGCGDRQSPTASPPVSPPVPLPKLTSELALTTVGARFAGIHQSLYLYYPEIVVRETTGAGKATINSVFVQGEVGDAVSVIHPTCFKANVVEPGGTWDTQTGVSGYCLELWSTSSLGGRLVTATVVFADDGGRSGSVTSAVRMPN